MSPPIVHASTTGVSCSPPPTFRTAFRRRLDGWALIVAASDAAVALEILDAYDRENPSPVARRDDAAAPSRPVTLAGAYVGLLLVGVFAISGPRAGGSEWFQRGSADATRMLAGEWWRAVTALTLHADVPHLLGNVVAAGLLVTAVCQQLGAGVGLGLLLLAGAGGNALTAAVHRGGHVSVGASTAIFAALGILAALRVVPPDRGARDRDMVDRRRGQPGPPRAARPRPAGRRPRSRVRPARRGALGTVGALTIRGTPPARSSGCSSRPPAPP